MSNHYDNGAKRRFVLGTLSIAWLKHNHPTVWKRFEDYAFKKFPGKRVIRKGPDEWLAEALGKEKP